MVTENATETLCRSRDFDRYLSALFAPPELRAALFSLYAFNYEIARVSETVSEPVMGRMRLQWWRDTVEGIYGGFNRRHEVAEPLAKTISLHALPRNLFDAMIDAREADLEAQPFADFAALEHYAAISSGHLMRLALRVLGAGDAYDDAASAAGRAHALTGLLRALPFNASRGRNILPADLFLASGVDENDFFSGRTSPLLTAMIAQISNRARVHLKAARDCTVPRKFLPALLPASLSVPYLKTIARVSFDPFRDPAELAVHRRQLAMMGAMMRGRV